MAANLLELFDVKTSLDYIGERQFQQYTVGETLFPETKYPTLEFEYFVGANDMPVAARVHSFDTEAEIGSVQAFKQALEAAYIKKKYQITEKDLIALRQPLGEQQRNVLYTRIFNVLEKAIVDVRSTVEIMRMQAIANGTLELQVHNGSGTPTKLTLDYNVPAAHKEVLAGVNTWDSEDADILGDIQRWAEVLPVMPTRALTSRKVLANMLRNNTIKSALYGTGATRVASLTDLNTYLVGIGLPEVIVYDLQGGTYREQAADGTFVTKKYFPDNKFVLLPDGAMGETLYGPTPDEGELVDSGKITEYMGNVIGYYYKSSQDPIGTWAKAATTAIPSFPQAGNVFQAVVLA